MPHRVVRSRQGHTLAAPNDDSACPVQAGPPASSLAGVEAPLGRDMASESPAPASPETVPEPASKPAPAPAGVGGPQARAKTPPHSPDHVEYESPSGKPTRTQLDQAPWSGYLCENGVESPSQSSPTSPQSAGSAPISAPFSPCKDPEFPSATLQPPPYENFTRNPNGMKLLASASSSKPKPPLHLRPEPGTAGEGGIPNPVDTAPRFQDIQACSGR
jgi:hypothetical protein